MMRRYHRWLALVFGAFLVWISATGVLTQAGEIVNNGGFESEAARRAEMGLPPAAGPAVPPGFTCPENYTCRPTPAEKPGAWNLEFLRELHSGGEFGALGKIVSILSGLALLFFSISGLYLYLEMWRGRIVRVKQGKTVRGGKWFWK